MIGGIGQGNDISKMIADIFEKINNATINIHKKDINYDEYNNSEAIEFAKKLEKAFANEEIKNANNFDLISKEQFGIPSGFNIDMTENLIDDKQIEVSGSMAFLNNNTFFNKNDNKFIQNLINNYKINKHI
ncbi:MAG: hypothetical protein ACI37S_03450 [Candidatus Gastranaerophilaceae bacterium]